MQEYAIEMLNITKRFPGIIANDDISFYVKKGEIHALLGENGAGKSTLMSVLFGMYIPEEGSIKINGKEVRISGPREANRLGIGMVHQHFKLVKNFTVLENIILGVETVSKGIIEKKAAREKIVELSRKYGLTIDPDARVSDITVGMQQRVEILKMLYKDNNILIFDEPTAVLTPQEIDELMATIKKLAKEGKSVIFITHKLREIKELCDRCTVLRKGKSIDTIDVAGTSKEQMAEIMVGRKLADKIERNEYQPGDVTLELKNVSLKSHEHKKKLLNDINFKLFKGEILCIAGIDGNGQSELIETITGLKTNDEGNILLNGEDISGRTIRYRNTHGISCIPEDRHKHGLVLEYTLEENVLLKRYFTKEYSNKGFIRFKRRKKYTTEMIERFDIRCGSGSSTVVKSMSGGNQQKAIAAREIDLNEDVLIAAQPTRGLDVGAIEGIHKELIAQRDKGKSILLVSLELDEVFKISDRILVMYEGEIVGEFYPDQLTAEEIGLYMSGAKRKEKVNEKE